MSEYMIDQERRRARRRLRIKESLQDPNTIRHLEAIGVAPGWHCLEVGAGSGSIAAWLARRVGASGRVLATDTTTDLLDELALPGLTVLRHDVVADELETDAFDLVHARDLLLHLAAREAVAAKLVAALKPGGWILLEELDVSTDEAAPEVDPERQDLYRRGLAAIHAFLRENGVEPTFGREVTGLLRRAGLEAVAAEGHLWYFEGGDAERRSPHMDAFRELRDAVVARGEISEADYGDFLALADDPTFAWREGVTVSARGRRAKTSS